jgi:pyrrolidone-carboxylate peptidase
MAETTGEYTAERQGHRNGYYNQNTGIDDKTLRDCEEEMGLGEGEYWRGCPEVLRTTLDVDGVLERMHQQGSGDMSQLPEGVTVKASDDAGNYLCDFIYYSSLSHFWRKNDDHNGDRPVVFLHVPPESDEEALQKGREVTEALIRAMVESGESK